MAGSRIEEPHNHSASEDVPQLAAKWLCVEIVIILLILAVAIVPAWVLLRWHVSLLIRLVLLIVEGTLLLLVINRAIPIATLTVRLARNMIVAVIRALYDIRNHTEKRRIKIPPEPLAKQIIITVEVNTNDIERMQEILTLLGDAIRRDIQENDIDAESSNGPPKPW